MKHLRVPGGVHSRCSRFQHVWYSVEQSLLTHQAVQCCLGACAPFVGCAGALRTWNVPGLHLSDSMASTKASCANLPPRYGAHAVAVERTMFGHQGRKCCSATRRCGFGSLSAEFDTKIADERVRVVEAALLLVTPRHGNRLLQKLASQSLTSIRGTVYLLSLGECD